MRVLNLNNSIPGSFRKWELHAMREMRRRYPNEHIFKSFNGPVAVIYFICTADGAESILKNKDFDRKEFGYQFLVPWLGEGIGPISHSVCVILMTHNVLLLERP